jgi:hypothetical protein
LLKKEMKLLMMILMQKVTFGTVVEGYRVCRHRETPPMRMTTNEEAQRRVM